MKNQNQLAWGVSLLVFGCLFLLRQLNFIPAGVAAYIFDIRVYMLIMGVIFLIFHSTKSIGWILIGLGLVFGLSDIIRFTKKIAEYIWPLLLVIAGAVLIFTKKR